MATAFSKAFVRLRQEAGFKTAYEFFHRSGGAKSFGCSFPNYLRIEKGSHLPQPQRLPHLCRLLRLPLKSEELRRLAASYLETWLGSEELLDWMLGSLEKPQSPEASLDPARQALQKVVRQEARPISLRQYEAIMASPASYWCY